MPCSSMVCRCSALSRRPSRPPWILGCRVLTRPSRISGEPVCSATSVTCRPDCCSSLAVPPVESRRTPRWARAWANSTIPVLSETESRAVWMFMQDVEGKKRKSGVNVVSLELLAQGAARDAQHFGGARLVAVGFFKRDLQHGAFDAAHDHGQHVVGFGVAQIGEIALEAVAHALL